MAKICMHGRLLHNCDDCGKISAKMGYDVGIGGGTFEPAKWQFKPSRLDMAYQGFQKGHEEYLKNKVFFKNDYDDNL